MNYNRYNIPNTTTFIQHDNSHYKPVRLRTQVSLLANSSCRSYLEDHIGPLTGCSLRRGQGWITLYRTEIGPQLKKEKMIDKDYASSERGKALKGYFISVYHGQFPRVMPPFNL